MFEEAEKEKEVMEKVKVCGLERERVGLEV